MLTENSSVQRACLAAGGEPAYAEAARRGFQPTEYLAGPGPFTARIARDTAEKARLLQRIELPK